MTEDIAYLEPYNRHRQIVPVEYSIPNTDQAGFLAPNSSLLGSVYVGQNSSVMYGAVLDGSTCW